MKCYSCGTEHSELTLKYGKLICMECSYLVDKAVSEVKKLAYEDEERTVN